MWNVFPENRDARFGGSIAASVRSALEYDELCSQYLLVVTVEPAGIVIEGTVPPIVAVRAQRVAREVTGGRVLDRMIWLDETAH